MGYLCGLKSSPRNKTYVYHVRVIDSNVFCSLQRDIDFRPDSIYTFYLVYSRSQINTIFEEYGASFHGDMWVAPTYEAEEP